MIVFGLLGNGMTRIPKEHIPYLLAKRLTNGSDMQRVIRLYGSVRKDGRIAFSALVGSDQSIGVRRLLMTPVRFARLCGWVLPLASSTPVYVVADYLADEGQEETAMVRLLQLLTRATRFENPQEGGTHAGPSE